MRQRNRVQQVCPTVVHLSRNSSLSRLCRGTSGRRWWFCGCCVGEEGGACLKCKMRGKGLNMERKKLAEKRKMEKERTWKNKTRKSQIGTMNTNKCSNTHACLVNVIRVLARHYTQLIQLESTGSAPSVRRETHCNQFNAQHRSMTFRHTSAPAHNIYTTATNTFNGYNAHICHARRG